MAMKDNEVFGRGCVVNGLYTIGKLSKIVGISADTLRYYDEIGLLKPTHIDGDSGYRYYALSQTAALKHIREFKEYGFSLNEIKGFLANPDGSLVDIYRKRYGSLLLEKHRLDSIVKKLSVKIKICEQQEELIMGKKVLLVDDAAFMRKMCREQFTNRGYEIVGEAENGEQAVEKYKELKPDVVILDITMPVMDGIAALKKIKAHDPNATVIMLSAMGFRTMIVESLIHGARRFIVKPFNAVILCDAVRDALENTEERFNPEVLKMIANVAIPSEDPQCILVQNHIDDIIKIALCDTEKAAPLVTELAERIATLASPPKDYAEVTVQCHAPEEFTLTDVPTLVAGEPIHIPIHALLAKIVKSQDEMKELLQKLVEGQNSK